MTSRQKYNVISDFPVSDFSEYVVLTYHAKTRKISNLEASLTKTVIRTLSYQT